jgi:hypothetical protein
MERSSQMATDKPQSFENHARFVPMYHGVVFGIFVLNLFWSIYRVVVDLSVATVMGLLLAFAFLLLFFYARLFALTAQDRVIRLEMRLRLQSLLPPDLQSEIERFTLDQLIGMRFASDPELPSLARKVLADNITDRKAIKQLVKNWQADYLRV